MYWMLQNLYTALLLYSQFAMQYVKYILFYFQMRDIARIFILIVMVTFLKHISCQCSCRLNVENLTHTSYEGDRAYTRKLYYNVCVSEYEPMVYNEIRPVSAFLESMQCCCRAYWSREVWFILSLMGLFYCLTPHR
jgi:hypothetical protein